MRLLKSKTFTKLILALLISITVLGFAGTLKVEAKGSWVQNDVYSTFYSDSQNYFDDEDEQIQDADLGEEENWVLRLIGSGIWGIGHLFTRALSANDSMIFSIEGIVLGKVASENSGQIFSFRLETGNFYGNVGAGIYAIFRSVCTSGLLIVFLYFLAKAMFSSSSKARDELKNNIYATLIAFMLMFLLPQIVDLVIFVRDTIIERIYRLGMGRTTIFAELEAGYNGHQFVYGILYCAYAGAIIFYMKDYIMLAIEQTFLFGMFPLFNMLGTGKKKFMSDWASTFIADIMMPVTDIICLIIPFMLCNYITSGEIPEGTKTAYNIVLILTIWGARTVRQQIQKLYGGITGSQAGQGLRGLSQLASLARAGIRNGVGMAANAANGSSNGNAENFNSAGEQAELAADSSAQSARNASEVNTDGLRSVDDIMAGKSDEDSRDNSVDELLARMHDDEDISADEMAENEQFMDEARLSNLEEMDKANDAISELEAANLEYDNELAELSALPESEEMASMNAELAELDNKIAENNLLNTLDREVLAGETLSKDEALRGFNETSSSNDIANMEDRAAFAESNAYSAREIGRLDNRNAEIDREIASINRERDNDAELLQSKKDISEYRNNSSSVDRYNAAVESRDRINEGYNSRIQALETEKSDNIAEKTRLTSELASDRGNMERRIADRNVENASIRQSANEATSNFNIEKSGPINDRILERNVENAKLTKQKTELLQRMEETRTRETESRNAERARINEAKNENKAKIETLRSQVTERKTVEENLARATADARGTTQTFSSANAFQTDVNVRRRREEATIQAVKNKAINISANDMRNFSASTRAQIAEARREQIRKENVRKLAHRAGSTVVRKIAVTGAQVTGAAFMAFGGEEASMTGAQLAGYAAEGMVDKAGNLATGVYNNQAEIRANVVAAGNGVANAGRAVVNTVRRVQRRPQTPNRYNPNAGNPTNPASSAPAQPRSASDEVFGNTQSGMRNH